MTLIDAVNRYCGMQRFALVKHLTIAGILNFDDCGKHQLEDFKEYLLENVSINSARLYFKYLKIIFKKYVDEESGIYPKFNEILRLRPEITIKTYLTMAELKRLEEVECKNDLERCTLYTFLISAYTGCRISDAKTLTMENISADGTITYISQKTSTPSTIPCKPALKKWIAYVTEREFNVVLNTYNHTLQRLCRRARINDIVVTYRGGKTYKAPKWQSITSHSARISFATNLSKLHAPLYDISRLMGHRDIRMTMNYIVATNVELPQETMKFFK